MRLLINGEPIPNVCKNLTQYASDVSMYQFGYPKNHCAEVILQHCNADWSPDFCTVKMITEATFNSGVDAGYKALVVFGWTIANVLGI